MLKENLRNTEERAEKWLELTESTFCFATYAKKAFRPGGLELKKEILLAFGKPPVVDGGKLYIEPNDWLKPIKEGYPPLEEEFLRLEPAPPLPPTGFNLQHGTGFLPSVFLSWLESESGGVVKYLYVTTGGGSSAEDLTAQETLGLKFYLLAEVGADVLEYTHTGLARGVKYYYVVTSRPACGTECDVASAVLRAVAGTGETGELEPISWSPERIRDEPEDDRDSSSGCFIATAAYGSSMSSEVMSMRAFRDNFLLTNRIGRNFTDA